MIAETSSVSNSSLSSRLDPALITNPNAGLGFTPVNGSDH